MTGVQAITIGGYQARPMEVTSARCKEKEVSMLAGFSYGGKEPPLLNIVRSTSKEIVFEV